MEGADQFAWVDKLVGGGIPIPPDTVSANMIGRVLAAAVARGAKRPVLLEAIGISERTVRNQLSRVPGLILNQLLTAVEQQLGNPSAAIEIGRDSRPQCFSDIGYATRLRPNLYDVIDANLGMQELRQNMYRVTLTDVETAVILSWNLKGHSPDSVAASIEFSLATYVRLAQEIWGDALQIDNITIQHSPRFDPARYQQVIGYPVRFGAAGTAVHFSPGQCRAPSPSANPRLLQATAMNFMLPVQWFDQGKRNSAFTYFYVWTELNKSPVTLDRIARSFGMAERTLRRNLVDEGFPFRTLLDTVRKNMCDLYKIENTRPLGEVAELLGYGELSAFTRAYKRWYGEPPSKGWGLKGENGGRSKD